MLEKYILARWMYSIGTPIMDDSEYNLLHNAVKSKYPDNEYVNRSWSSDPCPVELLKANGMEDSIKSVILTDRTDSIPSITENHEVDLLYRGMNSEHVASMKLDGWNLQASYYNGKLVRIQSRGRSTDAVINADGLWYKMPKEIPVMGKVTVVGEAVVSNSNFMYLANTYGNKSQRAAVATCLANTDLLDRVDFLGHSLYGEVSVVNPFILLEMWGFKTPPYKVVFSYEQLQSAITELGSLKRDYQYITDGVVVRGESTKALRVGEWSEPILKSYVTGYEESYGPHRISMKCRIFPVLTGNSTQSVIPVTNLQRIIDNNLQIGLPIAFRMSSMAIADLDETSTKLLQEEWEGRYNAYRDKISNEETTKKFLISNGVRPNI